MILRRTAPGRSGRVKINAGKFKMISINGPIRGLVLRYLRKWISGLRQSKPMSAWTMVKPVRSSISQVRSCPA